MSEKEKEKAGVDYFEFDDSDVELITRCEWATVKNASGFFVFYGYGQVAIRLDQPSFLNGYVWNDASPGLRASWGAAPQWWRLDSLTVGMEMRVTQEALGFRCSENFSTRWLWRDDLIKWMVGGNFPGLQHVRPYTGEPDIINVTINDQRRFQSAALVPNGNKLKLAPDACAETPRPWPRNSDAPPPPRWAVAAKPEPKSRTTIKAWGPAKLKF